MSSQLFAFQLARPLDVSSEGPVTAEYDPQTQVMVWLGSSRSQAVHCTFAGLSSPFCNAYGDYCNAWGGLNVHGYDCD